MRNHTEVVKQKYMSYQQTHEQVKNHYPASTYVGSVEAVLQTTAKKRQLYAPLKRAFDLTICKIGRA
ncbi:MAG: hypothetical protein KDE51_28300, partial [Anaerolineales bacterium]|nr:hypothetical protein [Anaerolineales bacterium]